MSLSSPLGITQTVDTLRSLISRWREDSGGTYRAWFLWEERLKNFRSIRRGLAEVVAEIEASTFGCAYRGSSLEVVVGSVAEQRQLFKGADHPLLWKPKLRIPDIYENRENQPAFARFPDSEFQQYDAQQRSNLVARATARPTDSAAPESPVPQ